MDELKLCLTFLRHSKYKRQTKTTCHVIVKKKVDSWSLISRHSEIKQKRAFFFNLRDKRQCPKTTWQLKKEWHEHESNDIDDIGGDHERNEDDDDGDDDDGDDVDL